LREIILEFISQRDLCFKITRFSRVFSKPYTVLFRASVTDYFLFIKSCFELFIVARARLASVIFRARNPHITAVCVKRQYRFF